MNAMHPTIEKPTNRNYVLDVLVDSHRQACQYDLEADSDIVLTFNSTVADWRLACDLLEWRGLGRAMNEWWGIQQSDEQWREVLEPEEDKTLGGVCDLIAAHARQPIIRESTYFGRTCRPADAFLTIRSLLVEAGADASAIRPSTPLEEFTRNHTTTFLNKISRLAPGALPEVKIDTPFHDFSMGLMLGSFLLFVVTACLSSFFPRLYVFAIVSLLVSWVLTFVTAQLKPRSVQFGELKTFRDLATLIATHVQPRKPGLDTRPGV